MANRNWISRVVAVALAASFATPAVAQDPKPAPTFSVTPEDAAMPQRIVEVGTPTVVAAGPSRFYASVDTLWLARDYPTNALLAQTVTAPPPNFAAVPLAGGSILTLGSLGDGDSQAGIRVTLGFRIYETLSLEFGYFGSQNWNRTAGIGVGDPPFANSPFLGTSIIYGNKSFDTAIVGNYSSTVNNAEVNLRDSGVFGAWNVSGLGGLRYFNLSEQLTLTGFQTFPNFMPAAPPPNQTIVEQTRTTTSNNLFGVQVGAEVGRAWWNERFGLAVNGKVGIFANSANQFTTNGANLIVGGSPTNVLASGRGSTDFASLYEGGLTTTVRVTSRIKVRAGYQVMFVQGLALAPTQLLATGTAIQKSFVPVPGSFMPFTPPATTLPVPGTASTLNTSGNMLLHGPFVGLDINY